MDRTIKESIIYDKLYEKYKKNNPDIPFYEIDEKLYEYTTDRGYQYKRIITNIAKNKFFYINAKKFKKEVKKMIEFVKSYPISERKYFDSSSVYAYGGVIHKDLIDFIEKEIENNIEMYNSEYEGYRNFGYYSDDFNRWYNWINGNNRLRKRKNKEKIKKQLFNLEQYFLFFKDRYERIKKEKELFKKRNIFKKKKKQTFIFDIGISGVTFRSDRTNERNESFKLLITHINEELAKKSCYYKYGEDEKGNLYDGLVKYFSEKKPHRIYNVNFKKIEYNKENIKKTNEDRKKRYISKYFFNGEYLLGI